MHSYQYTTLMCHKPAQNILVVTLNRPDAANALNTQMGRDLYDLFKELVLFTDDLRCVIMTGSGEKAFCAGGDLKERNGMSDEIWQRQHSLFEQAYYSIMDCPIPIIAAVNGAAYGGGCELALAADFIYASSNAHFALPETKLGIIPGGGGTQNLPRAVGVRRAKELIMSASVFSVDEAEKWGMVNQIVPQSDLLETVVNKAKQIAANAPIAVKQAKRAITLGTETELKTGLAIEIEAYNRTISTDDRREGVLAFNTKRGPDFKGV